MKKLVVVALVGACWSSSKPASQAPAPEVAAAPAGGTTYGGAAYGGATYGDVERARAAGVLGVMATQNGGAFASLTGTGELSSGLGDEELYAGLAEDNSIGSFDARGTGSGGGGTGEGTIGRIGRGSGTGSGYGSGRLGRAGAGTTIGQASVTGQLDKAIIRRYIRRNLQKLQLCYEQELLAAPALAGTVKADFTIGVDGKVTSSTATGVHANVASCVANVIKAIEFPTPKGGVVRVVYPFVFAPAADDAAADLGATDGTGVGRLGSSGGGAGASGGLGFGITPMVLGAPVVTGDFDRKVLLDHVYRTSSKLDACFAAERKRTPTLAGTVTAKFTIGVGGKVTSSTASGVHAAVDACVARVIERITFPAPKAGVVRVAYPITFAPDAGAGELGALVGDPQGVGGLGLRGTGSGGGGTGYGTIGIGTLGTLGHGSGAGSGYGVGAGGMHRRVRGPQARLGQPATTGDKVIIRRYVRRNIQKLQYCYEKQLLASPKIAGTLTATFTIGADGKVTRSRAKGVHPDVETCVATMIQRIEFPKPANGEVEVSYPFTFAPAPDDARAKP